MSDSLARARLQGLSETQMQMWRSLSQIKPTLANMYLGALRAIPMSRGGRNPEALVQAAHSIRELMEKLPQHLDAPIYAPGESLANRVHNLLPKWTGVRDLELLRVLIDNMLLYIVNQEKDFIPRALFIEKKDEPKFKGIMKKAQSFIVPNLTSKVAVRPPGPKEIS